MGLENSCILFKKDNIEVSSRQQDSAGIYCCLLLIKLVTKP